MTSARIVSVFDTTGMQGPVFISRGANMSLYLDALLKEGTFLPRAITRDPDSEASQKLKARGVQVVQANSLDKASLVSALRGSEAVYAVTVPDFPSAEGKDEVVQGRNMIDAARKVGVKFFIWSSLPSIKKVTGGKYQNCRQYVHKEIVAEYLKMSGVHHAVLLLGAFLENFWKTDTGYDVALPQYPATSLQAFVWVKRDVPAATLALLRNYTDASKGIIGKEYPVSWYSDIIFAVLGVEVTFTNAPATGVPQIDEMWAFLAEYNGFYIPPVPNPDLAALGAEFSTVDEFLEVELSCVNVRKTHWELKSNLNRGNYLMAGRPAWQISAKHDHEPAGESAGTYKSSTPVRPGAEGSLLFTIFNKLSRVGDSQVELRGPNYKEPCDTFNFGPNGGDTNVSGRSNVADWIRTVGTALSYHDMATHNAAAGTGGMDASIRFPEELARDENVGTGFNNTLNILFPLVTRYVSIADALTLGTMIAIESCGGPQISFRGGRIDATAPNAPGVPEPQQDLSAHIGAFARQGFSQTEMIGLIACGHTFGGVQHVPFPQIVPELNDPTNTDSVTHFDSTFTTFDNNVASEYISGHTTNPLVVGHNDTTNSDKRIFGSDGNVTMKAFANSPTLFASTCSTLFTKMFNSVPKGVKLTDVITPLPVKPDNVQLVLNNDTLQLTGEVRLWNAKQDSTRTVRVFYADRASTAYTHNATLRSAGVTNGGRGVTAAWYTFAPFVAINAAKGVSRMRFVVDGKVQDQGGVGFALNDAVVLSGTSCLTNSDASNLSGRLDVAVRTGTNPTRVFLEHDVLTKFNPPKIVERDIPRPATPRNAMHAPYAIWSLNFTNNMDGFTTSTLGVEVGGVKRTVLGTIELFGFPPC
ncbi:hypothetical protein B0H16DRAFT_1455354 [Mycena metata]|uniref:Peroxidase n=1 Tax=Mycena metata TaxID=1033252 RepID=A0AAD7JDZ8_9AGAR|nr:hypothetical protein B0H16DRAFT_1455354 [Mycena metata]